MSKLYCVTETVENGDLMVTAHPEMWVENQILLWPPDGDAIRSKLVPPKSDWIPYICKILKGSIGIL